MKALYPAILLLVSSLVQAQKYTISESIRDASNGESLIGASVFDIRSLQGTTANNYGFYSITLSEDSVQLRVSYGYEQQIVGFLRTAHLQDMTSGDPFAQPVNVYNNIQNGFGVFAGYSASVYTKANPKPVITSIDPSTGKAGDRIIISGENFTPEGQISVAFQSERNPMTGQVQRYPISGQVVAVTSTRIEVIVPATAVTGRILVRNGRMAVSDSDFVVME